MMYFSLNRGVYKSYGILLNYIGEFPTKYIAHRPKLDVDIACWVDRDLMCLMVQPMSWDTEIDLTRLFGDRRYNARRAVDRSPLTMYYRTMRSLKQVGSNGYRDWSPQTRELYEAMPGMEWKGAYYHLYL